jgi:hypothetical protein
MGCGTFLNSITQDRGDCSRATVPSTACPTAVEEI